MTGVLESQIHIAWHSPKLERRDTPTTGCGLYATVPIAQEELLLVWGGIIVTSDELLALPEFARHRAIQVEADQHLSSGMIDDDTDCINHSCNPTAGLSGQIALVALRDIVPDEQVCFDYAMSDAHPSFRMPCACGQPDCRKVITGDDWKKPELQQRYKGYFSPYIQRMIDKERHKKKPHQQA
ncbi:MAG: SET domain-containing protein-lysine N-methyltransferase [Chloroflexota bacterium]